MKFYVGDEDLGMVIESYYRYEERLYIRYLDDSMATIYDPNGDYEKMLQNRMIRQLQNRNEIVDFDFLARKCYFDCVSFVSLYGLLSMMVMYLLILLFLQLLWELGE